MRTQVVSFDVLRGKHTSALGENAANRSQRERMVQVLTAAMGQELTPRQKQCMELCVLRGMSQVEAGRLLGLNKSTVCRHIQKATCALKRDMPLWQDAPTGRIDVFRASMVPQKTGSIRFPLSR